MQIEEARLVALRVVVRVVLNALRGRPWLLLRLQLAALDEAHEAGSLAVMREVCRLVKLR